MTETLLPARNARFAPICRATRHRRLTGAVIADGVRDGIRVRLSLPVERVATVAVGYRAFAADFTVGVPETPHAVVPPSRAALVSEALRATAAAFDIPGRCEVNLRVPPGLHSGADVGPALAWAAADALLEAADVAHTGTHLRDLAGHVALGGQPMPAELGFGVHDVATGDFTGQFEDAPRFSLLVVHRPGSQTEDLTGCGTLPAGPPPAGHEEAAAWLVAVNGPVLNPVADTLEGLLRRHPCALGVVGGHAETDPLAILMPNTHQTLVAAQGLRAEAALLLKAAHPGWEITYTQQGRVR